MEVIAVFGFLLLFWLIWQLIQAKKHTRFKRYIHTELRSLVRTKIKQELEEAVQTQATKILTEQLVLCVKQ